MKNFEKHFRTNDEIILMNNRFNEIRIESIINYWSLSFQQLFHEYVANEKEDNYKKPRASRGGVYGTFANNRDMPRLSFVRLKSTLFNIGHY